MRHELVCNKPILRSESVVRDTAQSARSVHRLQLSQIAVSTDMFSVYLSFAQTIHEVCHLKSQLIRTNVPHHEVVSLISSGHQS